MTLQKKFAKITLITEIIKIDEFTEINNFTKKYLNIETRNFPFELKKLMGLNEVIFAI